VVWVAFPVTTYQTHYAGMVLYYPVIGDIDQAKVPGRIWRRSEVPLG
jgi:hypothetical protein